MANLEGAWFNNLQLLTGPNFVAKMLSLTFN
jgi:hypothetical protein